MNAIEFLKTIYVGDRGLKSIVIDGWNSKIKIQISCISRVRSENWDFYTDEDLENGYIVFEGVEALTFNPIGFIPNDCINEIRIENSLKDDNDFLFVMSVDSVNSDGEHTDIEILIRAKSIHLENPLNPGQKITT